MKPAPAYYLGGTLVLAAYILSGRNPARFRWVRLDWRVIGSVMRVGALSSLQSIQTNVIVGGATALALQGGVDGSPASARACGWNIY